MISLRAPVLTSLALLMLATLPGGAYAQPVSDTMTLSQVGGITVTLPFEGLTEVVSVLSIAPTGNAAQFGSPTVLLEPDGRISDVFGVIQSSVTLGGFHLAWMSHPEARLSLP